MSWEGFQRLLDRTESRIALYTVMVGSGSIMAYLASITAWLNAWGPIAWGVAFLSGALGSAAVLALATDARAKWLVSRSVMRTIDAGAINPLEDTFTKLKINATDLYSRHYRPHNDKRFNECEIYGPSSFIMLGRFVAANGSFTNCQIVIVRDNAPIVGVTGFRNCQFDRCHFFEITFCMPRETYAAMPDDFKGGIPVISDSAS